jgi:hypothetical protein
MVREHGYSIRKLADKIGKDKGYLENRLRLADAPTEVRALVSLRKDTLSHAYELMKVEDPRKRKRLADQVARGELTLAKLRDKIEGRPTRPRVHAPAGADPAPVAGSDDDGSDIDDPVPPEIDEPAARPRRALSDDALVNAKASLGDALEELVGVLRTPDAVRSIPDVDRTNLAKYLTIAKLRLENAIALVRSGDTGD